MSIRFTPSQKLILMASMLVLGCAPTRQLAIDNPSSSDPNDTQAVQSKSKQFQALPGFHAIDGDDYYVRLNSDFAFKGDNILKSGCNNIAPSYEKNELTAALIFTIQNDAIKLKTDATGLVYQSGAGKCNFKFDAKKLYLTPWIRLDLAKQTEVDYSFYSSANSNVDVAGLVGDVTTAGSLLSVTGVGMGVAVMGQFAGQWLKNNPQQASNVAPQATTKNSSITHTLPATVTYSGKTGVLNQTAFKVYAVAEGGINLLKPDTQSLGELTIYPELTPSLLLKNTNDGLPDAKDLSLEEIGYSPIKTATGEIKLLQLLESSQHPAKPNLKPAWDNYQDVESNCRKLKLLMKDLGFNKFDRNAVLYYFLAQSKDWNNYNTNLQPSLGAEDKSPVSGFRNKNFASCLNADDYIVMKAMGLSVNTSADWQQFTDSVQKKEQFLVPLKSIERQLLAVLRNPNKAEMERQMFPLLNTVKNGDGTVLVQDHLGDFGLEKLLDAANALPVPVPTPATSPAPTAATVSTPAPVVPEANAQPVKPVESAPIPGAGIIITAHQLAHVISSLAIQELSCARPVPLQQGNMGIVLFTSKEGGARPKGGAIEFEFSAGKVNRVTFQLPTHRDFEQDLADHPDIGGCKIDPAFLSKLH